MSAERIDVLAVLDRLISHQRLAWGIPDDDLVEARAAVAELIEAMRRIERLAVNEVRDPGNTLAKIDAVASAALDRIGGAS